MLQVRACRAFPGLQWLKGSAHGAQSAGTRCGKTISKTARKVSADCWLATEIMVAFVTCFELTIQSRFQKSKHHHTHHPYRHRYCRLAMGQRHWGRHRIASPQSRHPDHRQNSWLHKLRYRTNFHQTLKDHCPAVAAYPFGQIQAAHLPRCRQS